MLVVAYSRMGGCRMRRSQPATCLEQAGMLVVTCSSWEGMLIACSSWGGLLHEVLFACRLLGPGWHAGGCTQQ
jgi:hypothetical protein